MAEVFLPFHHFSTYTHYHTSLAGNEIVHQRMGYFHSCTQASHLSYLSLSLCSECLNEVFLHARFIYFLFIDNVAFFQYNTRDGEKLHERVGGTT